MGTEKTGYIEVAEVDKVIFTDSKYEDFLIYTETSNQGILFGTLLSNVSTLALRSNIACFNTRVGVYNSNPQVALEVNSTDAILIPRGATGQRPVVASPGQIRYNTTLNTFEGYGAGNTWGSLGGVKDVNMDTYVSVESHPTSNDDIIRFYTSNNEVLRVMSNGFVGISNITPSERLEISGGNAKFSSNIYIASRLGVGTSNPVYKADINGTTRVYETIGTSNTPTTGSLVIQHGNSNGVGSIIFPSALNYGFDYGYIAYYDNVVGTDYNYFNATGNESAALVLGSENDASGSTGPDSVLLAPAGNVAIVPRNAVTYITSNVGIGIKAPSEALDVIKNLKVGSNIYILSKVGVGNSNPVESVDVNGNMKASSNIYVMRRLGVSTSNPTEDVDILGNSKVSGNMYVMGFQGIGISNQSTGISLEVNGSAKINSNLEVIGNITVRGTTTTVDSTLVNIGDNIIRLNNGAIYNATLQAGVEINRGSGYSNYMMVFDEATDYLKIGIDGKLQTVATRDDIVASNSIPFFNSSALKYTGCNDFVYSSGNIGVGTNTPGGKLDVVGSFIASRVAFRDTTSNIDSYITQGSNGTLLVRCPGGANGSNGFCILNGAGNTQVVTVLDSGSTGIKTSIPTETLDVSGNIKASSNIYAIGRIGIAKSNPSEILEVSGNIKTGSNLYVLGNIAIGQSNPLYTLDANGVIATRHSLTPEIRLVNTGTSQGCTLACVTSLGQYSSSSRSNDFVIRADHTEARLHLQSGSGSAAVTVNSNNYVGVNTTEPIYTLDVNGGMRVRNMIYTNNQTNNCVVCLWSATGTPSNTDTNFYGFGVNGNVLRYQLPSNSADHIFYQSTYEIMRIRGSGNVGIGISNPDYKLDVNGDINISGALRVSGGAVALWAAANSSNAYYMNGNVGIGNSNPGYKLDVAGGPLRFVSTANNQGHVLFTGYGYYSSLNSGSNENDGVLMALSYNRVGNRQLTLIDTANATQNTNNVALRFGLYGSLPYIDCISTDGTTAKMIQIGNTTGVYIQGNLGIGTSSPSYKLDISGDINYTGALRSNGSIINLSGASQWISAGSNGAYIMNNVGIGTATPVGKLDVTGQIVTGNDVGWTTGGIAFRDTGSNVDGRIVQGSNGSLSIKCPNGVNGANGLNIYNGAGTNALLSVLNSGNTGIKTSTPRESLDVVGNMKVSSNIYTLSRLGVGSSNPNETIDALGNVKASGNVYVLGNVSIGSSNPAYKLDVDGSIRISSNLIFDAPLGQSGTNNIISTVAGDMTMTAEGSLNFIMDNNSNNYGFNAIGIRFGYGNSNALSNFKEYMRVTTEGNVGIGTSNPAYKLDVQGTLNATNINTSTLSNVTDIKMTGTGSNVFNTNVLNYIFTQLAALANMQSSIQSYGINVHDNSTTYFAMYTFDVNFQDVFNRLLTLNPFNLANTSFVSFIDFSYYDETKIQFRHTNRIGSSLAWGVGYVIQFNMINPFTVTTVNIDTSDNGSSWFAISLLTITNDQLNTLRTSSFFTIDNKSPKLTYVSDNLYGNATKQAVYFSGATYTVTQASHILRMYKYIT